MTDVRLFGYSDPFAAKAGVPIDFMISAEGTTEASIDIVRLIHGDYNPLGPGFIEEVIETDLPATQAVRRQYTQNGSFARVVDQERKLACSGSFTLHAFIWPTMPGGARQTIMGCWSVNESKGYALGINPEGKLEFWVGDGEMVTRLRRMLHWSPGCGCWLQRASIIKPERRDCSRSRCKIRGIRVLVR